MKTLPRDAVARLEDLDDVVACLEAALEDSDPRVIAATLGDVARSRAMTAVAAKAGPGRRSLYKAHSGDGNPAFAAVAGVMNALGLRLRPLCADREPGMTARDRETGAPAAGPTLHVPAGPSRPPVSRRRGAAARSCEPP